MDYGAKGDGVTDDTAAIIRAITEGRGDNPNAPYPTTYSSSSLTPALVYFPPGVYVISNTIPLIYYTQLVGDADSIPVLKMGPTGSDKRMIDALDQAWGGNLVNQNNFFHQVRNFVLDMSTCDACTGIHWQVAQATQLSNLHFNMKSGSKCQGIWMENGSGGFISDLVFDGGMYGMWVGNQQFTSRNITIRDASISGIYLNWDWGWTFQGLDISNTPVGIDVGAVTGSLLVVDSKFTNVSVAAVRTGFASTNAPLNNHLVLDNVVLSSVKSAVMNGNDTILAGSTEVSTVKAWAQGRIWQNGNSATQAIDLFANKLHPNKPVSLLGSDSSSYFQKGRPAFDSSKFSRMNAVTDFGISNDGNTDVTVALQAAITKSAQAGAVLFLPYGTYRISDTITFPVNSRVLGEAWSVIKVAKNSEGKFSDPSNPQPAIRVGSFSGQTGVAQLVDLLITTEGPLPGAVLLEWNMADPVGEQGAAGLWEVHFRVGGAVGTKIDPFNCPRGDGTKAPAESCAGSWALMRITTKATAYLENVWGWVADHDLDYDDQINVYNARGLLVESQGPVWMYGTAFEHSLLYQYNFHAASNVYMGMIQTETPYFQPAAATPFVTANSSVLAAHETDPTFCTGDFRCNMAFAIVIQKGSKDILSYGAGLYSFFSTWDQNCLGQQANVSPTCQLELSQISKDSKAYLYNFNTYGSVYMQTQNELYSKASSNMNTFCSTGTVDLNHYA